MNTLQKQVSAHSNRPTRARMQVRAMRSPHAMQIPTKNIALGLIGLGGLSLLLASYSLALGLFSVSLGAAALHFALRHKKHILAQRSHLNIWSFTAAIMRFRKKPPRSAHLLPRSQNRKTPMRCLTKIFWRPK